MKSASIRLDPDASQLAGSRRVISGELAERAAIRGRPHHLEQCSQPGIAGQGIGEADVVCLAADAEEREVGLFAGQPQADAGIGPARADGVGDAAMVAGTEHRAGRDRAGRPCPSSSSRHCRAPNPARAHPAQPGADRGPDGAEPESRCQGNPLFPVGQAEQLKILASRRGEMRDAPPRRCLFLVGAGQVDPCRVDQPCASNSSAARLDRGKTISRRSAAAPARRPADPRRGRSSPEPTCAPDRRRDGREMPRRNIPSCGEQPQRRDLDRIEQRATADLGSPVTARAREIAARPSSLFVRAGRAPGSRNSDSTVQPRAAASASAAAVDGTSRPVSIALIPARDSPDRRASSACDHPSRVRISLTSFSSIGSSAMIVSSARQDCISDADALQSDRRARIMALMLAWTSLNACRSVCYRFVCR